MSRTRYSRRERPLAAGAVLLVLLAAGFVVTGQIINRRAAQMSDRIVTQISESHCLLLQAEFDRSQRVLEASARYIATHDRISEAERQVLTAMLLEIDPKAGSIWFANPRQRRLYRYAKPGDAATEEMVSTERSLLCEETAGMETTRSGIIEEYGVRIWVLVRTVRDKLGACHICGIDFPLPRLYAHMAEQNPHSRSSATLFDPEGVVIYHPDSLKMGLPSCDPAELEAIRNVKASGRNVITNTVSDYLGIDELRIYYPLQLAGQQWVAGIGIPRMIIEQEIDDFHFYTILTAVVSVLFFAALLIVAQRRWRREYDLRRLSEQESAQLQLQQLLEQIDPHFLFNSLNSLYALIRCNPEQAREFTLTLSRVYRRVLERRKQILSTLAEEVDFTEQYHALQKIRFGESLELTTAIDPALGNRRIPSMSLQTLVENAVKHNSFSDRHPLHIRIRTEGGYLLIENDGSPRSNDNPESLGVGLERIRSVYRFYTAENLSISTAEGLFCCRLPLLPAEE